MHINERGIEVDTPKESATVFNCFTEKVRQTFISRLILKSETVELNQTMQEFTAGPTEGIHCRLG